MSGNKYHHRAAQTSIDNDWIFEFFDPEDVGHAPLHAPFSLIKSTILEATESDVLSAGAGITDGTGTVFKSSFERVGDFFKTTIFIDLTGLQSSTTDLDIIGSGLSAATLGQVLAANSGTPFSGTVTCLEAPATGADDIDFYSAVEGTGAFDTGIATLDETALLTKGGAWAAAVQTPIALTALPAANEYLYLTCGEAGVVGTYTAGQFLIQLWGV
jgi:hypothetical protein